MLENEDDIEIEQDLLELNDKISDLRSVKEQTPEQKEELSELIEKRKTRTQKRIDSYAGRAKAAEEKARQAELRAQQLEEKFNNFERRQPEQKGAHQKVKFDGDEFYTDQALNAMVNSKEMSEQEAWDHQEQRRVAAAAERLSKKSEKNTFERTRNETIQSVLKEFPKLNPSHREYNLDDPFTAEVERLLKNGYQFNPSGLREAVNDAKKNLRMTDKRPDISDDLSVTRGGGNSETTVKQKTKVVLEDWEQDNAIRMWANTGLTNPKTGKPYTKTEAVEKALQAKTRRAEELATR